MPAVLLKFKVLIIADGCDKEQICNIMRCRIRADIGIKIGWFAYGSENKTSSIHRNIFPGGGILFKQKREKTDKNQRYCA